MWCVCIYIGTLKMAIYQPNYISWIRYRPSQNNNGVAVEIQMNHSEHSHEMHLKISKASQQNDGEDKSVGSPTYGKYLQKLANDILKEKRLSNTLTNVVIPAFDINKLSPIIFSSYEVSLLICFCNSSFTLWCVYIYTYVLYYLDDIWCRWRVRIKRWMLNLHNIFSHTFSLRNK